MFRRSVALFSLLLALGSFAGAAAAADFGVVPLKVNLTATKSTEVLTIHNGASTPLRLQVEGKAWSIAPDRTWVLTDTEDLVFSPELLTIAPGADAALRVGVMVPPEGKELAYRLLLTELRDSSTAVPSGLSLNVRTQISLPVFLTPAGAAPDLKLVSAQRRPTTLRLQVHNDGTKRMDAQGVKVELLNAQGQVVETDEGTSSYALAGAAVDIDVPVKAASCSSATEVRLTLSAPETTLTQSVPTSASSCGSASL